MHRTIRLGQVPERIVSLVPSQTELLYDLGLGDRVVGITKFCIHPEEWFRNKTRIGGTKNVNLEKVKALQPDLIIGNKEENEKSDILSLEEIAPVWMSDIFNLEDSLSMINSFGEMLDVKQKAEGLCQDITKEFQKLKPLHLNKKVLYLIWKDPYMGVGPNTFVHHILEDHLGAINILEEERYPVLELANLMPQPEMILLSSEPFPFKEKHSLELQMLFPKAEILLVDGEYFSWYGSRLLGAPQYFQQLFSE
ncbi:ABC transporter substrate-binding protein [Lishizhenia tianjinensis]|nr:helical backbone metal receptor [Lishizhenia tianjinensis]